jgi:hypothetical protein
MSALSISRRVGRMHVWRPVQPSRDERIGAKTEVLANCVFCSNGMKMKTGKGSRVFN